MIERGEIVKKLLGKWKGECIRELCYDLYRALGSSLVGQWLWDLTLYMEIPTLRETEMDSPNLTLVGGGSKTFQAHLLYFGIDSGRCCLSAKHTMCPFISKQEYVTPEQALTL